MENKDKIYSNVVNFKDMEFIFITFVTKYERCPNYLSE